MLSNTLGIKEHVRVSTYFCPPFNFWANTNCAYDSRDGSHCKDLPHGIESMMFPLLTSILGMTFSFEYPHSREENHIVVNSSIFSTVNGATDITSCGIWLHEKIYEILEPVVLWTPLCFTFLVPKPKLKPITWTKVFQPFSPTIWLLIACSILMVSLLSFCKAALYERYENRSKKTKDFNISYSTHLLGAWGIVLGSAIPVHIPPPTFLRVLLVWWSFVALNLANCYNSKLFPVLTFLQYEPEVNTLEDLIKNNFTWGATYSLIATDILNVNNEEENIFFSRFILENSHTEQRRRIKSGRYAVPIISSNGFFSEILNAPITPKVSRNLRIMEQCLSSNYVAMYFRKKSSLIEPFQSALSRIYESGLNIKLLSTVREKSKHSTSFIHKEPAKINSSKPMGMSTLYGAFSVLMIGWILAFIVLIIEKLVFVYHCRIKTKCCLLSG